MGKLTGAVANCATSIPTTLLQNLAHEDGKGREKTAENKTKEELELRMGK